MFELVETGSSAVLAVDVAGIVTFCSDELLRIIDRDRGDVVGRDWFAAVAHESGSDTRARGFFEALSRGTPVVEADDKFLSKDGGERTIRWNSVVLRDSSGLPAGALRFGVDVTSCSAASESQRDTQTESVIAASRIASDVGRSRLEDPLVLDLLDDGHDFIYSHDLDFNVTSISRKAERITGYSQAEALGLNFRDVLTPESLAIALEMFSRKMDGGGRTVYEVEIVTKSGVRLPFEVSSRVVFENGMAVGVQGIARDIRERRRSQEEIAERGRIASFAAHVGRALTCREKLDDALCECAEALVVHFGSSIAAVWVADTTGAFLELRATAGVQERKHPSTARVAVGTHHVGRIARDRQPVLSDLGDPASRLDDDESWATSAGMVAFAGYPLVIGDRLVGVMTMFSAREFSLPVLSALESIASELALGIDRAIAIEALARSEERYRSLFDGAPIGIYRTSPEGRVLDANPAFVRMLGHDDFSDLASRNLDDDWFIIDFSRIVFRERLERETEVLNVEGVWKRKDGSTFFASENAKAIRSESGDVLYFEGTVEDVSDRKLAQIAAIEAHEAAIESARVKSRFMANMSHEIRTPLNGIIGMTQLLMRSQLTRQQSEYVETLRQSSEILLSTVNDVLDLAKIESGRIELEAVDFSPRTLINATARILSERALSKGLGFVVDIAPDVPELLRGDSERLRQVLLNLAGNAVKFTESGSVLLRLRVISATPLVARLCFEVSDTGIGISREARSGLFEAFVQADASSTRRFGGTGLGLAIAREIVELMDGHIVVESESGHGSTFRFILSLNIATEAAFSARAAAKERIGVANAGTRFDARVLLVDDDDVSRFVARTMLVTFGCSVVESRNGREALESIDRERFDIVFMDCQMPVMDGFEATRLARTRDDRMLCSVPIIALTAGVLKNDLEQCLAAGMDDSVAKPVLFEDICRALDRWVGRDEDAMLEPGALFQLSSCASLAAPGLWHGCVTAAASLVDEMVDAMMSNDLKSVARSSRNLAVLSLAFGSPGLARFCSALAESSIMDRVDTGQVECELTRIRAVIEMLVRRAATNIA